MTAAYAPAQPHSPALRLVQSSRVAQRLASLLLVLLVLSTAAMAFVPWQQSAKGTGKVVAYVPQERQQTVTSPVTGIVIRVGDDLVEGTSVKQGEFILELQPKAANLVEQLRGQRQDLQTKLNTAQAKTKVYEQNITALEEARDYAVKAADQMIDAARAKLEAKRELVPGYESKAWQAQRNYERQNGLLSLGAKSEKEVEYLKKDWDVTVAELDAARREVEAAHDELAAKVNEREQKMREQQTKVEYARAMREEALGEAATVQKEMKDLEIKLAELDRMVIEAPRDGNIFRLPLFERGQLVKEGDPLFTIVTDSAERAVELWMSGNDTPLIQQALAHGDAHVRLQFEGWPAVQFAGWPSVAVGTFGGRVVSIDASDDGMGNFRVLVKPDGKEMWPSAQLLRQGVRANGWVMLSRVSLGFEIWRQLNGFPPVINKGPSITKDSGEKKKVKLPK